MKVLLNRKGHFMVSNACMAEYFKRKNIKVFYYKGVITQYLERVTEEEFIKDYYSDIIVYLLKEDFGARIYSFFTRVDKSDILGHSASMSFEEYGTDEVLISVFEDLGEKAMPRDFRTELEIVEIPDDIKWQVREHNGVRKIQEVTREW